MLVNDRLILPQVSVYFNYKQKKKGRKTGKLINYYFEGFGSSDVDWTLADWIIRLSDLTKHYTGVIASSSLTTY